MALEAESTNSGILTTVDGRPLKAALAEAERTRRIKAVLLVMPLFIFILIKDCQALASLSSTLSMQLSFNFNQSLSKISFNKILIQRRKISF